MHVHSSLGHANLRPRLRDGYPSPASPPPPLGRSITVWRTPEQLYPRAFLLYTSPTLPVQHPESAFPMQHSRWMLDVTGARRHDVRDPKRSSPANSCAGHEEILDESSRVSLSRGMCCQEEPDEAKRKRRRGIFMNIH